MLCISDHLKMQIHFPGDPIVKTPLQGAHRVLFPRQGAKILQATAHPTPKKSTPTGQADLCGGQRGAGFRQLGEQRLAAGVCPCAL